jgi:hypothetical protein
MTGMSHQHLAYTDVLDLVLGDIKTELLDSMSSPFPGWEWALVEAFRGSRQSMVVVGHVRQVFISSL